MANIWQSGNDTGAGQMIQVLQNASQQMAEKRRLDLEQQFYQQQADQTKANQMIEKLKVMPQLMQGFQNAGQEVTPDVISKASQAIGLPQDLSAAFSQMKPMTITQTDEKGNQIEVPINKVTANYQASLAKGAASYRRGVDVQELKNEGGADVQRIRNQGILDKLSYSIKNNAALSNNKSINGMLNFIVKAHNSGMQPSDVDSALQNLHEAVQGINDNSGANAPNPNTPAINAPKAGLFSLGKYSFTQGDVVNKGGGSQILAEIRGGRTLQAALQQANTYLNQYKDNPKAQEKIIENFKKQWPEMGSLLGGE